MFKASRRDEDLVNAETIARVRGALSGYRESHGRDAMVSVAHVLDLLNPRGLWSLDPQRRKGEPEKPQPPQDTPAGVELDPITGCRPVVPG